MSPDNSHPAMFHYGGCRSQAYGTLAKVPLLMDVTRQNEKILFMDLGGPQKSDRDGLQGVMQKGRRS